MHPGSGSLGGGARRDRGLSRRQSAGPGGDRSSAPADGAAPGDGGSDPALPHRAEGRPPFRSRGPWGLARRHRAARGDRLGGRGGADAGCTSGRREGLMDGTEALSARRRRLLGPGLRQFYDFPFHPVRGEGVWLYDAEGRAYLDAYNNVPHVGHCQPDVVAALARQAATLNSNTRYLDEAILDYAECLLATLPPALDVCAFVCTGSEANDLAWRLARAVTGKSGVIVSRHAYHGNTTFLSTLDAHRPGLAADRASVATVPAPVDVSGDGFENALGEAIATLERSGHGVAAVYIDTCFANESLIAPDPAVMARAIARLKAAGGL